MDAIKISLASKGKSVIVASMGRSGSTYFQNEIAKQLWSRHIAYALNKSWSSLVQVGAWNPNQFFPCVNRSIVYKTHAKYHENFDRVPTKLYVYGDIEHCILSTYRLAVQNEKWWRQHLRHFGCSYSAPDALLTSDPLDLVGNIKSWLDKEDVVFVGLDDFGVDTLNKTMQLSHPEWINLNFKRRTRGTKPDMFEIDPSNRLLKVWRNEIQPLLESR